MIKYIVKTPTAYTFETNYNANLRYLGQHTIFNEMTNLAVGGHCESSPSTHLDHVEKRGTMRTSP